MAKSSKTTPLHSFNKSQALLLLLALHLISSLCYARSLDVSVLLEDSSAPKGRALLEIGPTNKQSNMEIHQEQTHYNPTTTSTSTAGTAADANRDQQFRMAAHEVPSGPNPESNR